MPTPRLAHDQALVDEELHRPAHRGTRHRRTARPARSRCRVAVPGQPAVSDGRLQLLGNLEVQRNAWQPGRIGALRMGLAHGAWCVGCCWGLMAALFALGVMSVGWMVFIAALIAAEKLLPWRALASYGIAVLLLAMGLLVAVTPSSVPGLTLPDLPQAMRAHEMHHDSMGGGAQPHGEHAMPSGSMHDGGMPADHMPGERGSELVLARPLERYVLGRAPGPVPTCSRGHRPHSWS